MSGGVGGRGAQAPLLPNHPYLTHEIEVSLPVSFVLARRLTTDAMGCGNAAIDRAQLRLRAGHPPPQLPLRPDSTPKGLKVS
jgi:hypothetical protein